MGFTQLMLLDERWDGKARADLDRIYTEVKRVATGVERLHSLALSLQEGGSPGQRGVCRTTSPALRNPRD
jgi:hypothetical protein